MSDAVKKKLEETWKKSSQAFCTSRDKMIHANNEHQTARDKMLKDKRAYIEFMDRDMGIGSQLEDDDCHE